MKHCGTQELETGRLLLRRLTMDDSEMMFNNWASDQVSALERPPQLGRNRRNPERVGKALRRPHLLPVGRGK